METLQDYNWRITIGLVLLVIGVIIAGAYFIAWYGKQQAKLASEYMRYYEKIQKVLDYEICEQNRQWIERLFDRLDKCKYKNREMTEVLTMEFFRKYEDIAKKRVLE
jgi:predicted negative regulator of RcsB-dependent stress response